MLNLMKNRVARFHLRTDSEHHSIREQTVLAEAIRRLTTPTVLSLFCLCFLVGAIRSAAENYLWMDEVLAVWAARLPTFRLVWTALFRGSEASPPTYHLLLHALIKAGATTYILLRLPSIVGALVSGLCIFTLLRKYLDAATAGYGMAFCLLGVLAEYGVEARPYALVTASFAGAILMWDRMEWQHPRIWRVAGISMLLILAICLHFYAALLVPCMAAMELLWSAIHSRIRIRVWTGLFIAGASSFVWLPLIKVHSRFIAGEVRSSGFYAKPTLARLLQTYADLIVHNKKQALFIGTTLSLIFVASVVHGIRVWRKQDIESPAPCRRAGNPYVIGIWTVTFPLLVFVFAYFVTNTFNTRYALIGALGFSILTAYTISRVRITQRALCTMILAGCPLALLSGSPPEGARIPDQLAVLNKAPMSSYPIIIANARLYFELVEAAPPSLKARLVYVDLPPGAKNLDPTNEHHVDRWHQIRSDLRIMSAKEFFAHNPHFYVFHTSAYIYVITDWLLERGLIGKPIAENEDCWLLEAQAPDPAHDR